MARWEEMPNWRNDPDLLERAVADVAASRGMALAQWTRLSSDQAFAAAGMFHRDTMIRFLHLLRDIGALP